MIHIMSCVFSYTSYAKPTLAMQALPQYLVFIFSLNVDRAEYYLILAGTRRLHIQ